MAWGYEACFIIEHDETLKRKIDCKDCVYYEKSDKSCMKTPRYLPEDGYNSWRHCNYFELDTSVSHYEEKKAQYIAWSKRVAKKEIAESKEKFSNGGNVYQTKYKVATKEKKKQNDKVSDKECRTLILREYEGKDGIPKEAKQKLLDIYLDDGRKKSIQVAVHSRYAYVKKGVYPEEYMFEVRRLFKKNEKPIFVK